MTPNEKLDLLLEYLEAFELDLQNDYMKASDDIRPFIGGKLNTLEEIIDYAENNLGLIVRTNGWIRINEIYPDGSETETFERE